MRQVERYVILSLIMLLFGGVRAEAAWDFQKSTDPMTDEQVAFASIDNEDSSMGIAIKCWNDRAQSQWFAVVIDVDFANSSKYPEKTDITIRADQAPPQTAQFVQVNLDNRLSYVARREFNPNYDDFVATIARAKNVVAVDFMNFVNKFDVSRSLNIAQELRAVCPYFGR